MFIAALFVIAKIEINSNVLQQINVFNRKLLSKTQTKEEGNVDAPKNIVKSENNDAEWNKLGKKLEVHTVLLHIWVDIYKVWENAKLFVVKEKKDKMNGWVRCRA